MKNRKFVKFLISIFILGFIVSVNNASAHEIKNHVFLTDKIVKFYNQNFPNNKISDELKNYVVGGTRREDDASRWMNHFYDPVYNRGLIDSGLGTWQMSKYLAQDGKNQNSLTYKVSAIIASTLTATQKLKISELLSEADFNWQLVMPDYWPRFSTKFVQYGAGVVNLFFQEAEKAKNNPNFIKTESKSFLGKIINTTKSLYSQTSTAINNIISSVNNFVSNIVNKNQGNLLSSQMINVVEPIINTTKEIEKVKNSASVILDETKINVSNINTNTTAVKIENNINFKVFENIRINEANQLEQSKQAAVERMELEQITAQSEQIEVKAEIQPIVFRYSGGGASASVSGGDNSGSVSGVSGGGSNSISSDGSPQNYPKILITEIQLSPISNRFIELYNPNNSEIDLTNWYIHRKTQTGSIFSSLVSKTYFNNKTIAPRGYFLISREDMSGADIVLSSLTLTNSNVIQLKNPNGEVSDKVGWGEASDCEGSCIINPADSQSIQRRFQDNAFIDDGDNANDFEIQICPSPKAQSAECAQEEEQVKEEVEEQVEKNEEVNNAHLVISEIYPDKTGNNFDFVEIYNPSDNPVSLASYSLKKQSMSATTTSPLANFSTSHTIAAKSFFLIGLDNYGSSSYAIADKLNSSYFLPTSGSEAINIILMDGETIIDQINYNPSNLLDGQSLERKAFSTSTVDLMSSGGEHRFSGNGYDSDSDSDFILRSVSEPQNSQNFPEPRNALTIPQNFTI